MPIYDLKCPNDKCRARAAEVICDRYLAAGEESDHECPRCGALMHRMGGDLPARMRKCWEGYSLQDM